MNDYISDSETELRRGLQLYSRKKIYARLKRLKAADSPRNILFSFYSEILNRDSTGAIMEHFRNLTESILETGTAIPVPESQLASRRSLGLPQIRFDTDDVKILAKKKDPPRTD